MGSSFASVAVAVAFLLLLSVWLRPRKTYPPGPPGIPFFGNAHRLAKDYRWKYMASTVESYGDVTYFHGPATSILTLNSYKAIQDLLINRGSIYSDRPPATMVELMGIKNLMADRYGPWWKTSRRLFGQHMNKTAIRPYWSAIEKESKRCVTHLYNNRDHWLGEMRLHVTRAILGVTYDLYNIETLDDELVKAAGQLVYHTVTSLVPGKFLINTFPFLKYLPEWVPIVGNELRLAREWGEADRKHIPIPFERVKQQAAVGEANPSFALSLLNEKENDENLKMWLSAAMFGGGSETSLNTMHCFFVAMILYPDVQKKAQEEMDRVIGTDRLPTIADRDDLPYLDGIVKEVFRWWIISPFALARRVTEDDEYRGYFIPKGTVVLPNTWIISRDEEHYPDPDVFRPERYTQKNKNGEFPMDPRKYAFGFGRRICPGVDFADASIFSHIATILAACTISEALDEKGQKIIPSLVPRDPVRPFPQYFPCAIKPRSPAALALIRDGQIA